MLSTQEAEKHFRLVGIYSDQGAGTTSYRQTRAMWKEAFPSDRIISLKRKDLEAFLKKAQILIMPGGRDIFYHKAIGKQGCQAIREFVHNGGVYVGICAGAYFASSYIDFYATEKEALKGIRHLGLWKGTTFGPLYRSGEYRIDAEHSASIVQLQKLKQRSSCKAYYYGGCTFLSDQERDFEVLTYYTDPFDPSVLKRLQKENSHFHQEPAIAALKKKEGLGSVYLFGYHPEFRSKYLHPQTHEKDFLEKMQKEVDPNRVEVFRSYFCDWVSPASLVTGG